MKIYILEVVPTNNPNSACNKCGAEYSEWGRYETVEACHEAMDALNTHDWADCPLAYRIITEWARFMFDGTPEKG